MDEASFNADNELLKGKLRSYDTLNTLYHETRQEMELLNKQLYVRDNIIADLKSRLARYERIYMTVGDSDSVVIGPSMSLLESLCKEICKLKQKRNEMELKASLQAEEIQKLTAELTEKENELERIRSEPGHEKDQEIQRLRSALQVRERSEATRAVLCTSLEEEADQLRGQLGATVTVCKELLARLERDEKKSDGAGKEEGRQQTEAKEKTDTTDMSAQLQQLHQENHQLKQRVAYVQSLNSQWQKYDSSREDYIRGLCQRLKETTGQGLAPGLGSVSTAMLHQEISRLNCLLEDKIGECVRLSREVEDVKSRDQERIQMLEQQVLIYTEDFKSERVDRERAQGQIQDMKEQIRQLKQQLHKQQGSARDNRDVVPLCRVHIGHQIAHRRNKDSAKHLVRSSAERQQQQAPAAAASQSPPWSDCPDQSELRCPCCQARFNDTEKYYEHWVECAEL